MPRHAWFTGAPYVPTEEALSPRTIRVASDVAGVRRTFSVGLRCAARRRARSSGRLAEASDAVPIHAASAWSRPRRSLCWPAVFGFASSTFRDVCAGTSSVVTGPFWSDASRSSCRSRVPSQRGRRASGSGVPTAGTTSRRGERAGTALRRNVNGDRRVPTEPGRRAAQDGPVHPNRRTRPKTVCWAHG